MTKHQPQLRERGQLRTGGSANRRTGDFIAVSPHRRHAPSPHRSPVVRALALTLTASMILAMPGMTSWAVVTSDKDPKNSYKKPFLRSNSRPNEVVSAAQTLVAVEDLNQIEQVMANSNFSYSQVSAAAATGLRDVNGGIRLPEGPLGARSQAVVEGLVDTLGGGANAASNTSGAAGLSFSELKYREKFDDLINGLEKISQYEVDAAMRNFQDWYAAGQSAERYLAAINGQISALQEQIQALQAERTIKVGEARSSSTNPYGDYRVASARKRIQEIDYLLTVKPQRVIDYDPDKQVQHAGLEGALNYLKNALHPKIMEKRHEDVRRAEASWREIETLRTQFGHLLKFQDRAQLEREAMPEEKQALPDTDLTSVTANVQYMAMFAPGGNMTEEAMLLTGLLKSNNTVERVRDLQARQKELQKAREEAFARRGDQKSEFQRMFEYAHRIAEIRSDVVYKDLTSGETQRYISGMMTARQSLISKRDNLDVVLSDLTKFSQGKVPLNSGALGAKARELVNLWGADNLKMAGETYAEKLYEEAVGVYNKPLDRFKTRRDVMQQLDHQVMTAHTKATLELGRTVFAAQRGNQAAIDDLHVAGASFLNSNGEQFPSVVSWQKAFQSNQAFSSGEFLKSLNETRINPLLASMSAEEHTYLAVTNAAQSLGNWVSQIPQDFRNDPRGFMFRAAATVGGAAVVTAATITAPPAVVGALAAGGTTAVVGGSLSLGANEALAPWNTGHRMEVLMRGTASGVGSAMAGGAMAIPFARSAPAATGALSTWFRGTVAKGAANVAERFGMGEAILGSGARVTAAAAHATGTGVGVSKGISQRILGTWGGKLGEALKPAVGASVAVYGVQTAYDGSFSLMGDPQTGNIGIMGAVTRPADLVIGTVGKGLPGDHDYQAPQFGIATLANSAASAIFGRNTLPTALVNFGVDVNRVAAHVTLFGAGSALTANLLGRASAVVREGAVAVANQVQMIPFFNEQMNNGSKWLAAGRNYGWTSPQAIAAGKHFVVEVAKMSFGVAGAHGSAHTQAAVAGRPVPAGSFTARVVREAVKLTAISAVGQFSPGVALAAGVVTPVVGSAFTGAVRMELADNARSAAYIYSQAQAVRTDGSAIAPSIDSVQAAGAYYAKRVESRGDGYYVGKQRLDPGNSVASTAIDLFESGVNKGRSRGALDQLLRANGLAFRTNDVAIPTNGRIESRPTEFSGESLMHREQRLTDEFNQALQRGPAELERAAQALNGHYQELQHLGNLTNNRPQMAEAQRGLVRSERGLLDAQISRLDHAIGQETQAAPRDVGALNRLPARIERLRAPNGVAPDVWRQAQDHVVNVERARISAGQKPFSRAQLQQTASEAARKINAGQLSVSTSRSPLQSTTASAIRMAELQSERAGLVARQAELAHQLEPGKATAGAMQQARVQAVAAYEKHVDLRAQARADSALARPGDSALPRAREALIERYREAIRVGDMYGKVGVTMDVELVARMKGIGRNFKPVEAGRETEDGSNRAKFRVASNDPAQKDQVHRINQVLDAYESLAQKKWKPGQRKLLLEKDQIQSILDGLSEPAALLEMGTGFGKTSTVMPLQSILMLDLMGDKVGKIVLVFTDPAKAQEAIALREALALFEQRGLTRERGIAYIDDASVGHGKARDVLAEVRDAKIVFATRAALKSLKLNTETSTGIELEASKKVYELLTKNTHGMFDEAHELPDASHLILGRDSKRLTEEHPGAVAALTRVDHWLNYLKAPNESYAALYDRLAMPKTGMFERVGKELRLTRQGLDHYLARRGGLDRPSVSEFLRNPEYTAERAALNSMAEALGAVEGSDYASIQKAKGYENAQELKIVPVSEGSANALMRFGNPFQAGARQLIGARRIYGTSKSANLLLEMAETNAKAVRVTDATVIKDFVTKTFVTGTAKSVEDSFAFGLGIKSVVKLELFSRYRDGANKIKSGELLSGADIQEGYRELVKRIDRTKNYVLLNEATDIHAAYSLEAFKQTFGSSHDLVVKEGKLIYLIDQGGKRHEITESVFKNLLVAEEGGLGSQGTGRPLAIYMDPGAVTGTDLALSRPESKVEAKMLAEKTVFVNIFGRNTGLTRAGQSLGRDRMYGREADGNTVPHEKIIMMVGERYQAVGESPARLIEVLEANEVLARNGRVQKAMNDGLHEAMVNRFRLMKSNAATDLERDAIDRARTEFQSESGINDQLLQGSNQTAFEALRNQIEHIQDSFNRVVNAEYHHLSEANRRFVGLTRRAQVTFSPNGPGVFRIERMGEDAYVHSLLEGVTFERGLVAMDFADAVHTINTKFSAEDFSFKASQPRAGKDAVLLEEGVRLADRIATGKNVPDLEIARYQSALAKGRQEGVLNPATMDVGLGQVAAAATIPDARIALYGLSTSADKMALDRIPMPSTDVTGKIQAVRFFGHDFVRGTVQRVKLATVQVPGVGINIFNRAAILISSPIFGMKAAVKGLEMSSMTPTQRVGLLVALQERAPSSRIVDALRKHSEIHPEAVAEVLTLEKISLLAKDDSETLRTLTEMRKGALAADQFTPDFSITNHGNQTDLTVRQPSRAAVQRIVDLANTLRAEGRQVFVRLAPSAAAHRVVSDSKANSVTPSQTFGELIKGHIRTFNRRFGADANVFFVQPNGQAVKLGVRGGIQNDSVASNATPSSESPTTSGRVKSALRNLLPTFAPVALTPVTGANFENSGSIMRSGALGVLGVAAYITLPPVWAISALVLGYAAISSASGKIATPVTDRTPPRLLQWAVETQGGRALMLLPPLALLATALFAETGGAAAGTSVVVSVLSAAAVPIVGLVAVGGLMVWYKNKYRSSSSPTASSADISVAFRMST